MAIGDLDNDGRVDVVVSSIDGPAYILHNETPASESLDYVQPGRGEKQSGWHWRTNQNLNFRRQPVCDGYHREQLPVFQR